MWRVLFLTGLLCLVAPTAMAQDPVKVDPKHYKVEVENAQVRVLCVHHDPRDRAPMHEHPAGVVVWLSDGHVKDIFPDGKTSERQNKAGQARWRDAIKHANENLGDTPTELIVVELKAKPAAKHAAKKPGT